MRSNAGYTLIEMLIVVGLIGVVSAIAVPVFFESSARTNTWTGSELIGAQIRQTRLRAISRNRTYQIRFDCPGTGQFRALVMTGVPATDDAEDRCDTTVEFDGGVETMPPGASFGDVANIQINGRGVVSVIDDVVPYSISVTNGTSTRTLSVTATGQVSFSGS
jgi:prepilin-type N-terminal cleavage/methylation domain-containing protein